MNFMHQDALIHRSPAHERWAIVIAIGALAIFIGAAVVGNWFLVPAMLPLLSVWPVEVAMGASGRRASVTLLGQTAAAIEP